jgi:hypothetical protein
LPLGRTPQHSTNQCLNFSTIDPVNCGSQEIRCVLNWVDALDQRRRHDTCFLGDVRQGKVHLTLMNGDSITRPVSLRGAAVAETSTYQPPDLRNCVVLVAGATRGVGRGIALAFGEAGATVYCTGRARARRWLPAPSRCPVSSGRRPCRPRITRAGRKRLRKLPSW